MSPPPVPAYSSVSACFAELKGLPGQRRRLGRLAGRRHNELLLHTLAAIVFASLLPFGHRFSAFRSCCGRGSASFGLRKILLDGGPFKESMGNAGKQTERCDGLSAIYQAGAPEVSIPHVKCKSRTFIAASRFQRLKFATASRSTRAESYTGRTSNAHFKFQPAGTVRIIIY